MAQQDRTTKAGETTRTRKPRRGWVEFYRSRRTGLFHWRAKAANGQIIAQGEGFTTGRARDKSLESVRKLFGAEEIDVREVDA